MKKIYLLLSVFFAISAILNAQPIFNSEGIQLHHYLSQEEKKLYETIEVKTAKSDAPEGIIRPIAEWEPSEAVLIRYPFGIPMSLIKEMAEDCKVITIVASTSEQNTVTTQYTNNEVNIANCEFLIAPTDSYWTRDYGPWFIAIDNQQVAIFDFTYNRPRPKDNNINTRLETYLNLSRYSVDIQHCGGNFMDNGISQAASTDLLLEENTDYSQTEIEEIFHNYMGIEDYFFMEDPLQDYIKHIDCWGKFLAPNKILIGQVPVSDSRYQLYENVADYFANTLCSWGTPYQVYRVFSPGGTNSTNTTPFTNSLILNKKVFVPITNSPYNNDAISVYEQAMPGYEIIPIQHNGWENTDALHCRTHEIADHCMLYISHNPLHDTIEGENFITIDASIYSYCNNNIISDSVNVFIKKFGETNFTAYNMTYSGVNQWVATINNLIEGDVEYYISATDDSQRKENHPYIGKYDPHKFYFKNNTVIFTKIFENNNFLIYQQPDNNQITIENYLSMDKEAEIFNILGIKIMDVKLEASNKTNINISALFNGVYFVKINGHCEKFVKN